MRNTRVIHFTTAFVSALTLFTIVQVRKSITRSATIRASRVTHAHAKSVTDKKASTTTTIKTLLEALFFLMILRFPYAIRACWCRVLKKSQVLLYGIADTNCIYTSKTSRPLALSLGILYIGARTIRSSTQSSTS